MAYGSKSLRVVLIVLAILVAIVLVGYLGLRFALPHILAQALNNPDNQSIPPEMRQAARDGARFVIDKMAHYGLDREQAIQEFEKVKQQDFVRTIDGFAENPPATPGEAARFAVESLGIQGINLDLLQADISAQVSQEDYQSFLDELKVDDGSSRFAGAMFPVLKDTWLELLRYDETGGGQ